MSIYLFLRLLGSWWEVVVMTSHHDPTTPPHSPSPIPLSFNEEWGGRVHTLVLFLFLLLRRLVGSSPEVDLTVPAGVGS